MQDCREPARFGSALSKSLRGEERCAQFHEMLKEVTWEVGIEMRPIEAGLESHFGGLMLPFVSTSLQAVALGSYSI